MVEEPVKLMRYYWNIHPLIETVVEMESTKKFRSYTPAAAAHRRTKPSSFVESTRSQSRIEWYRFGPGHPAPGRSDRVMSKKERAASAAAWVSLRGFFFSRRTMTSLTSNEVLYSDVTFVDRESSSSCYSPYPFPLGSGSLPIPIPHGWGGPHE